MSQSFSRLLLDEDLVEHFLTNVLRYDYSSDSSIISHIVQNELAMKDYDFSYPTLRSKKYRTREFKEDNQRWKLRQQIVSELYTLPRMQSDDEIALEKGGACPVNETKHEKQAYVLIGLPASGKSSIANLIADNYGAIIIDSDYAKRKLPEFTRYNFGATLVHEESDALVNIYSGNDKPSTFKTLIECCFQRKTNIVVPKIGHNHESIVKFSESLQKLGYQVHLTLINLDRVKATIRALERFKRTKRYVPLGLIFDGYGNEPILTYYRLKNKFKSSFTSFGEISTDVEPSELPNCLEYEDGNPARLFSIN